MKKYLLLVLIGLFVGSANATLLTFDDIQGGSTQNSWSHVGNYKGFNFTVPLAWIDVVDSGWNFGAVSGDFALLNNGSSSSSPYNIITEQTGADFTFDGLWAKKWNTPPNSGGTDSLFGTLSGFNDGSLVWSVNTSLNGSYEFYSAQTGTIDELRLGFGNSFLVDNIALNSNSIPEPTSLALLGLGLAGFGFLRKKKMLKKYL